MKDLRRFLRRYAIVNKMSGKYKKLEALISLSLIELLVFYKTPFTSLSKVLIISAISYSRGVLVPNWAVSVSSI